MKTIKQIKQLVENIAINSKSRENEDFIKEIINSYLTLFQFNIEASSSENALPVYSKIAENVNRKSLASYLPHGQHTVDKVRKRGVETPTIMEWRGGKAGQNFVINYTNKTAEKAQGRLNQLVIDMLLSLPGKSINLHFVDLAFSAQASFLTRNFDEKLSGKLISSPNESNQLND